MSRREFNVGKWLCHTETYKHFISRGFKIMEDLGYSEIETLITEAASTNDVDMLRLMIENGLKFEPGDRDRLHTTNENGTAALRGVLRVIKDDQIEFMKCLIEGGGFLNSPDQLNGIVLHDFDHWCGDDLYDVSALSLAVGRKLFNIATYLLEVGITVDQATLNAAGIGLDEKAIQMLREAGVDFNTSYGEILQAAISSMDDVPIFDSPDSFHDRQLKAIELILESGIDVNVKTLQGRTMGHYAIYELSEEKQRHSILKLLLEKGLDADTQEEHHGETMLYMAASRGFDTIVDLLIEKGADVNICDKAGRSPLLALVKDFHPSSSYLIRELVKHKADVNIVDKNNNYVLQRLLTGSKTNSEDICFLLKSTNIQITFPDKFSEGFFRLFPWSVLCTLMQAGCYDRRLLDASLFRAIKEDFPKGYALVKQAVPLHFQDSKVKFNDFESFSLELYGDFTESRKVIPSLKSISACHIRKYMFDLTGGKSIYLTLQHLAQPPQLPAELSGFLTLQSFSVDDSEHPPPDEAQNHLLPPLHVMMLNAMMMNGIIPSDDDDDSDDYGGMSSSDDDILSPVTDSDESGDEVVF